jgi:hypothetical protein
MEYGFIPPGRRAPHDSPLLNEPSIRRLNNAEFGYAFQFN